MEKHFKYFVLNLGLLVSGIATVFSGFLIQVEYHMGNHGSIAITQRIYGINYTGWTVIHKISVVLFSALMIYHIFRHWKWYKVVIQKKLITKNRQVIFLSSLYVLVAITGFLPWFVDLLSGDKMMEKGFIEFHDKLSVLLSIYLILHIIKRIKWFFAAFERIIKGPDINKQK